MPGCKRIEAPKEYREARSVSDSMGERADCAVMAVAFACDVSYEKAHEALRLAGRKSREGTYPHTTRKAVESLGYRLVAWKTDEMQEMLDSYPFPCKTITTHHPRRCHKQWKDQGTLLFSCRSHVLCVKDGVVLDWSINRSLHVHTVYSVEKA